MNDSHKQSLYKKKEKDYGDKYRQHFFEQYKLYIEGIEKISDRREGANRYFIAINTAILTALIISFKFGVSEYGDLVYILLVLGLVICFIFYFLLRSYRQINTGKFEVLHEIEKHLPLALYSFEWEVLKEGKKKNVYFPFSHIESKVPIVFGLTYFISLLMMFC